MIKKYKGMIVPFLIGAFVGASVVVVAAVWYKKKPLQKIAKLMPVKTKKPPKSGILSDFEGKDAVSWGGDGAKSKIVTHKNCPSGKCLKVDYEKKKYPGLASKKLPGNWSDFHTLKLDIFNPTDRVIKFGLLVKDHPGGDGYVDRFDGSFALRPGINNFIFNITGLRTNGTSRQMDISKIKELIIFLWKPEAKTTLYVDNIRLETMTSLGANKDGMLNDFDDKNVAQWGGAAKIDVVKGKECKSGKCLKATYPPGKYPGFYTEYVPSDWSDFDSLQFDVYNPYDEVVNYGIILKDQVGGHKYPDRHDSFYAFRPGWNSVIFNITGVKTNNKQRQMETSKIQQLNIFLRNVDKHRSLYFDNIRLTSSSQEGLGEIRRFDFGRENSEVWPGFLQVTDKTRYDFNIGYGWTNMGGLYAEDRRYPDPLLRDWVRGSGPFAVDLPNGTYTVYIMIEDPGFWEYYQHYKYRTVKAEDVPVIQEGMMTAKFFKEYYFYHLRTDDKPKSDMFKDYVQKRFVWRQFKTEIKDGQLSLTFDPGYAYANTVSALIVAPVSKEKEAAAFLNSLEKDRKAYFISQYIEQVHKDSLIDSQLEGQFSGQDFIAFHKNYLEDMHPNEPPKADQLKDQVELHIAQGEKEPFALGVYGLKDGKTYQVRIKDLQNDQGGVFSAENIKIRKVQYKHKLLDNGKVYQVRGELLRDDPVIKIEKDLARYVWFAVNVPNGTPAGIYKGSVELCLEDGNVNCIKPDGFNIALNVLPFEIDEPGIPVGLFYEMPFQYNWFDGELKGQKWTAIERHLKDMREHGMNTIALEYYPKITGLKPTGEVQLDFRGFDELFGAIKHFGFNYPISGYGLDAIFKELHKKIPNNQKLLNTATLNAYQQINERAKMVTGQEIIIGLADEPSNPGGEGHAAVIQPAAVLKANGLNATGYFNGKVDQKIFQYFKTITMNNGAGINQQLLEKLKKEGKDYWFYNIGLNRMTFGFYLWKTKASGRVEWHYQLPAVDPYNDLDGRESDFCLSYPSLEGPINTPRIERIAEGIDDLRYLRTLERLIRDVRVSNDVQKTQALANAESLLKEINSALAYEVYQNTWTSAQYENFRKRLQQAIMSLM